jgi:hypothetical protein
LLKSLIKYLTIDYFESRWKPALQSITGITDFTHFSTVKEFLIKKSALGCRRSEKISIRLIFMK